MKIAILGTRGLPPRYGGFETFAAELSTRLAARGHHVTVYGRHGSTGRWQDVQSIILPSIRHKYLETVAHSFLSALDALRRDFDVVLLCNAVNAFLLPLLRARRYPVAINVDGIERRRRKWNMLGRLIYAIGETLSVSFSSRVVADADVIAAYYRQHYGLEPIVIPYGAEFPEESDTDFLVRLGIEPRNYILYVSRFEPENNPLEVVQAYQRVTGPPLVMVGEGLYAPDLAESLRRHAGPKILFPGPVYGADYRTLQRNTLFYVQATEVGGTHPAMIEAMGSGGAVLAHATPENREVGADTVGYFRLRPAETLSEAMRDWLVHPEKPEALRPRARARAAERFAWESVVETYERLFRDLRG